MILLFPHIYYHNKSLLCLISYVLDYKIAKNQIKFKLFCRPVEFAFLVRNNNNIHLRLQNNMNEDTYLEHRNITV